MPRKSIAFIISCGREAGMGHFYRSYRLAKALSEIGTAAPIFFLSDADCLGFVEGFPAYPIAELDRADARIAVVDGILFDEDFIDQTRAQFSRCMIIDDLGERKISVDLILNPNLFAHQLNYSFQPENRLLLGPDYALIDPRFAAAREQNRSEHRAVITFGGGQTAELSLQVAKELCTGFHGNIDVALGAFEGTEESVFPNTVHLHKQADMPALMAKATVYVGSLGTSFLEAQSAGLVCITSPIIDNQEPVIDVARDLGAQVIHPFDSKRLAIAARSVLRGAVKRQTTSKVDGQGVARAAAAISNLLV